MRVDNLQAETTITEQGERVYSPNNKPSASDIGALPAGGKAVDATKADTVTGTSLGTTTSAYITIPDAAWYGNAPIGKSQMVRSNSHGLPIPSDGFVHKIGGRDVAKGHAWIFVSDYTGAGSRLFFGVEQNDSKAPRWYEAYSDNHKPTAADVGAHPTSWKPTWDDVSSKPAQATRWPKWGEISDRPGTMPPSSHTHPWSQITDIPSYATRWPNWGEISGKPGNLLTQTTADTRYMSKNAKPNADTLDGLNSTFYRSGMDATKKAFIVGGDANTYYPVLISGHTQFSWSRYNISRAYNDTAPNSWNNSTHKGGLTFCWEASGDSGWGGNDHEYRVLEFDENYTTMVAGMQLSVNGMIVWLRGGGARYYINGPRGVLQDVKVTLGTYTASDKKKYAPRTSVSPKTSEIYARWCIRTSGTVYDRGNRVYSAANKPSPNDIGAYSKGDADTRYVRFDYSGNTSYPRLVPAKGDWLRSPAAGFLPDSNGGASLGTSSWRWSQIWGNAIYDSGHRVYSAGNKPSAATIGAEPKLAGDRKRKISYGTGNPSGGSDGDVYIQYK